MIKLTQAESKGVSTYIAPEHITIVMYKDGFTKVYTTDSMMPTVVKESPEEVARLIVEAKHRKMKLQAGYGAYFTITNQPEQIHNLLGELEREDYPS